MSILGSLFGGGPRAANRGPMDDFWYRPIRMAGVAGIDISPEDALCISVVWGCVDSISKAIAASPWLTHKRDANGHLFVQRGHPLNRVLSIRPNPEMTAIGFREAMFFVGLTLGNAYAEIRRDRFGNARQLDLLEADRVRPRRLGVQEDGELVYDYENPNGTKVTLKSRDVFHLHGPGVHGLMGDCIVSRMTSAIALAAAQERFASTYFGNNTQLGGVLETPRILNDETAKRMRESWEEIHKGAHKAHKVAILENGVTYRAIDSNAEKAQLIESRKFQIEEICRYYGVPPHKVQHLERATFSNIEHQSIEWVRDGLTPWARRLEQEADWKLFASPDSDLETKVDTSWLSHGDATSRATFYRTMRETGAMTVNKILEREGENAIGPEGDVRILPLNFQTHRQLELAEEKAELEVERLKRELAEKDDDIATEALAAMFSSVFARYEKRIAARRSDLVRAGKDADEITAAIDAERKRLRQWLTDESAPALALARKVGREIGPEHIHAVADAIDHGKPMNPLALGKGTPS